MHLLAGVSCAICQIFAKNGTQPYYNDGTVTCRLTLLECACDMSSIQRCSGAQHRLKQSAKIDDNDQHAANKTLTAWTMTKPKTRKEQLERQLESQLIKEAAQIVVKKKSENGGKLKRNALCHMLRKLGADLKLRDKVHYRVKLIEQTGSQRQETAMSPGPPVAVVDDMSMGEASQLTSPSVMSQSTT